MKRLLLSILFIIQGFTCLAVMKVGSITEEIETVTSITRKRLRFAVDEMDYVAGGITFNYPAGLFSASPTVRITIETKLGYSSSELITPCITSNDATQSTIRVNKGTVSSFEEAPTGYVCVHLFAVGE